MTGKKVKLVSWVEWVQFFVVAGMAPFFLFPDISRTWVFMILPFLLVLRWVKRRRFFDRTILDWGIFVICIQVFITCLIVPDIGFSLSKISGLVYGIFLFYAFISLLKTQGLIKKAVVLFMVGSVVFAVLGFLGTMSMGEREVKHIAGLPMLRQQLPHVDFNLTGAEKGFNPNPVGGTLVLMIPLFIVFSFWYRKKHNGPESKKSFVIPLLLLGLIFQLLVLLFTLSRGSWIALVSSSLILSYLFIGDKKKYAIITTCAIVFFVIFYIALIGPQDIKPSSREIGGKIVKRNKIWAIGVESIGEHPLFGVGLNCIRLRSDIGDELSHNHNHFIHIAAELGIPALIAYMAILIGAGYMCVRVWRRSESEWMKMAVLGLGWGQVAHLIFGIGDSVPLGAKPGIVFWVSLAMITSIYNLNKKA